MKSVLSLFAACAALVSIVSVSWGKELSQAEVRAAYQYAAQVVAQKNTVQSTAPATASASVGKVHYVSGKFYRETADGSLVPCVECNKVAESLKPASFHVATPTATYTPAPVSGQPSAACTNCPCAESSSPAVYYVRTPYSTPAYYSQSSGDGCGLFKGGCSSSSGGCGLFRGGLFKGILCAPFKLFGGCR